MEPDTQRSSTGLRPVRILLVDDDPLVLEALGGFLELRGWNVTMAETGEEALQTMTKRRDLDLVLLDVNLPGLDGFDVLERSQEVGVVAPVIVISTSADDASRLRALGLGAEDYLTKPLDPEALVTRVETVLGLSANTPVPERHRIGQYTVDLRDARLYGPDEEAQSIPEVQRDVLRVLLQHRGQTVSRKRLLEEGMGVDKDTIAFTLTLRALYRMLDEHMEEVRKLVEPDPRHPVYIERVFGQGYRLRSDA